MKSYIDTRGLPPGFGLLIQEQTSPAGLSRYLWQNEWRIVSLADMALAHKYLSRSGTISRNEPFLALGTTLSDIVVYDGDHTYLTNSKNLKALTTMLEEKREQEGCEQQPLFQTIDDSIMDLGLPVEHRRVLEVTNSPPAQAVENSELLRFLSKDTQYYTRLKEYGIHTVELNLHPDPQGTMRHLYFSGLGSSFSKKPMITFSDDGDVLKNRILVIRQSSIGLKS